MFDGVGRRYAGGTMVVLMMKMKMKIMIKMMMMMMMMTTHFCLVKESPKSQAFLRF